jgi:hypothetical protein
MRVVKPKESVQVLVASEVSRKVETLQTWHGRMGHQNKAYVEKFLNKGTTKSTSRITVFVKLMCLGNIIVCHLEQG